MCSWKSRWPRRWTTRLRSSTPLTVARPRSVCASRTATTPRPGVCGRSSTPSSSGPCTPRVASVIWSRDAKYYQRRPWRGRWATAGGGVLINQAIHTLDLLQWYLGDVQDVRGSASTLLLPEPIEVEDTASMVLMHGGGRRSIFFATNTHTDNEPVTIELRTQQATLRLHTDLTVIHSDGSEEILVEQERRSGEKAYWGASHGRLIDDFYRHVRSGRKFWIDAREASKTLTTITSVYDQSTLRGRSPVLGSLSLS